MKQRTQYKTLQLLLLLIVKRWESSKVLVIAVDEGSKSNNNSGRQQRRYLRELDLTFFTYLLYTYTGVDAFYIKNVPSSANGNTTNAATQK